jgi:hypothetical protein
LRRRIAQTALLPPGPEALGGIVLGGARGDVSLLG